MGSKEPKCFVCGENCKYGDICDTCRVEFLDQHICEENMNQKYRCDICDEPVISWNEKASATENIEERHAVS